MNSYTSKCTNVSKQQLIDNCSGLTSQVKIKPQTWWIPGVLRPFAVRAVVDCCPANGRCNLSSLPCGPFSRSGVQCHRITSVTGGPSSGVACGYVRLRGYGSCVLSAGFIVFPSVYLWKVVPFFLARMSIFSSDVWWPADWVACWSVGCHFLSSPFM